VTTIGDPIVVALRVAELLERIGVRYTIGGSIAASLAGEPRSTIDIDVVVALTQAHVAPMLAAFGADFYLDDAALSRAIDTKGTVNLVEHESNIKVDLFVAGGTPLDDQQLTRRQLVEIRPGQSLFVHPAEDILLQKLRWFVKGGETSDRQWRDILGIIRTQGERLDRVYLAANAPVLEVSAPLDRALQQSRAR